MKSCGYCGRENEDHAGECVDCGIAFPKPRTDLPVPGLVPTRESIDLDRIENAFEFEDGLSRPDWKVIYDLVETSVEPENREAAWEEVASQWLYRLKMEMGGYYHVAKSRRFLALSPLEPVAVSRMLDFAERTLSAFEHFLGDLRMDRERSYGPQVLMLFDEDDDYYQYISGFYSEGVHPTSAGVHIGQGYAHIAVIFGSETNAARTIAHELSHQVVNHLKIPTWLNEALAQVMEKTVGDYYRVGPLLTRERTDEHRQFWNAERIQQFWAGTSFRDTGEGRKLSYHLAEIMMNLLMKDRDSFLAFVRVAALGDGGQTASLDVWGVCLGETLAGFLGEGNWRPQRKAIRECWEAEKKKKTKAKTGGAE